VLEIRDCNLKDNNRTEQQSCDDVTVKLRISMQLVVQPVAGPVVSCTRGMTRHVARGR